MTWKKSFSAHFQIIFWITTNDFALIILHWISSPVDSVGAFCSFCRPYCLLIILYNIHWMFSLLLLLLIPAPDADLSQFTSEDMYTVQQHISSTNSTQLEPVSSDLFGLWPCKAKLSSVFLQAVKIKTDFLFSDLLFESVLEKHMWHIIFHISQTFIWHRCLKTVN